MIYENGEERYNLSPEGGIKAEASIGTIAIWLLPEVTIPKGWLICDGREFDAEKYPELYDLAGDNHTPDLRIGDRVLKGTNNISSLLTKDDRSWMPNVTGATIAVIGNRNNTTFNNSGVFYNYMNQSISKFGYSGNDQKSLMCLNPENMAESIYHRDIEAKCFPKSQEVYYIIKALDMNKVYKWIDENKGEFVI